MRFHLLTIFPEFFDSPLSCGLFAKAAEQGLVAVERVNPRDFAADRHRTVDDRPYGGGPGMVMTLPPLCAALESLASPGVILRLAPGGRPLTQAFARELSRQSDLTLLCGRYEGIDARLDDLFPIIPVSVGDFVMSGGEAGALCLMEAVSRLIPGFMGKEASADEESFAAGLLEYPHYSRPEVFRGLAVPEILVSGNHALIADWRRKRSLEATLALRPELLAEAPLSAADLAFLRQAPRARPGRNLRLVHVHGPVLEKTGKTGVVSLTNFDIHDIARVSRTYGLAGYHVVTPLEDQRALGARLLSHWTEGAGGEANPDRAEAMGRVSLHASLAEVVEAVTRAHGQRPLLAGTSARGAGTIGFAALREELSKRPVLAALGAGHGLAPEVLGEMDVMLPPVRPFGDYNHLSVRSAASVVLDRLLGDVY